jgi:glycosyltransferase 2 family protein
MASIVARARGVLAACSRRAKMTFVPVEPSELPTSPPAGRRPGGRFRLLGWIVSLVILAFAVNVLRGRWDAVGGAGGLPSPGHVVAVIALYLGANITLASNWRGLVALVGPRLPLRTAWWIWSVSQLARFGIGFAHVAGRAIVGRRYGVTATAGGVTTLLEIAWYTSVTSTLALVTMPWWLPIGGTLTWLAWVGVVPAGCLLLGLAHPRGMVRVVSRLLDWGPLARLTRGRLSGLDDRVALRRTDTFRLTGMYLVNTSLRLSGFFVLFASLGGDLGADGLQVVGAYAMGHLVGALAVFAPGGIGPREGASALILAPVIGGGPALVLVAAARLLEIVAELAFFGLAWLLRTLAVPAPTGDGAVSEDA